MQVCRNKIITSGGRCCFFFFFHLFDKRLELKHYKIAFELNRTSLNSNFNKFSRVDNKRGKHVHISCSVVGPTGPVIYDIRSENKFQTVFT